MQFVAERKELPTGVRVISIIVIVLTLLGILLRLVSSSFSPLHEIPEILFQLLLIAPFAWLLRKRSKISYQVVLAVIVLNLAFSIINVVRYPGLMTAYPLVMQSILGLYLFNAYSRTFNPGSKSSARHLFDRARSAEIKKNYAEAQSLYRQILATCPGTLEAELSAEALQYLPASD